MQEIKDCLTTEATAIIEAIESNNATAILTMSDNLREMGKALSLYRKQCAENKNIYLELVKKLNKIYEDNGSELRVIHCHACSHISIVKWKYIDTQLIMLEKIAVDLDHVRVNEKWHCQQCLDKNRYIVPPYYGKNKRK